MTLVESTVLGVVLGVGFIVACIVVEVRRFR